ncbi:MAG: hypothetical protein R3B90_23660 [Planctomycetaceae bacterium]
MCHAAQARSTNFIVTADDPNVAQQVADTAEHARKELAVAWLGHTLPDWYRPCPVKVKVGQLGAGGATTFTFDRGEVGGWNMEVQGTLERVLDSVIPHEVSHTIFASHFRRPLPRWADEGAATLIEHVEERKRQEVLLDRVLQTNKRIPLARLLEIKEYPAEMEQVYTLYAEGYSLARYLVQAEPGEAGRRRFLNFLQDAHTQGWGKAIRKHYGYQSVTQLERDWTNWVVAGYPRNGRPNGEQLAMNSAANASRPQELAVRGQNQPAGTSIPGQAQSLATGQELPVFGGGNAPGVEVAVASPQPLPLLRRERRGGNGARTLEPPAPAGATLECTVPSTRSHKTSR